MLICTQLVISFSHLHPFIGKNASKLVEKIWNSCCAWSCSFYGKSHFPAPSPNLLQKASSQRCECLHIFVWCLWRSGLPQTNPKDRPIKRESSSAICGPAFLRLRDRSGWQWCLQITLGLSGYFHLGRYTRETFCATSYHVPISRCKKYLGRLLPIHNIRNDQLYH